MKKKPAENIPATLPLSASESSAPDNTVASTPEGKPPEPPRTEAIPTTLNIPPTIGKSSYRIDHDPGKTTDDLATQALSPSQPGSSSSAIPETIVHTSTSQAPSGKGGSTDFVQGYEILGELGRGGMGVVYKARQLGLNRLVALKMILSGAHAGQQELARFKAEAEAVAQLQHPNIVQIYDVGVSEGRPFFSLEFLEGGSLADRLKGEPLSPRASSELIETLARTMYYAHERGIVHRDLKPANILLAGKIEEGRGSRFGSSAADRTVSLGPHSSSLIPKITDFGLAKNIKEDTSQTKSGSVLGTPNYMAPEQAAGKIHEIGPLADVYALGAMLYELLTGRPPFTGESPWDVVKQVLNEEPLPPTHLRRGLNRDLETICLKCLQKEPRKRYPNALALADDLRRTLDGQAILARPVSDWEKMLKWARRNPAVAGLTVTLVAVILASITGLTILWRQTAGQRDTAVVEKTEAVEQREEAERLKKEAQESYQRSRREAYASQLNLVQNALTEARFDRAKALLGDLQKRAKGENDLRGFEWFYLWDVANSQLTVKGHTNLISGLLFSPDGQYMATSSLDGTVKIWDPKTGKDIRTLQGHEGPIRAIAYSADGKWIATGGEDGTARVWNAQTGKAEKVLKGHTGFVTGVVFGPDGRHLATASEDRTARLWDLLSQTPPLTLNGHAYGLTSIAFRSDGKQIATGSWDRTVKLWNAFSGKEQHTLSGHGHWVRVVAYSPGGERLATASWDRTVKLWNPEDGSLTRTLRGYEAPVQQLCFSPDGERLLTLGVDQMPRLWDLANGDEAPQRVGNGNPVRGVAFSADGQLLASIHFDFTNKSLEGNRHLAGHTSSVHAVAFRPKSKTPRLASSSADGTARIWEYNGKNWETIQTLKGHDGPVRSVAYSPDGELLATGGEDGTTRLWDTSGKMVKSQHDHSGWVTSVAFSPDGKQVASGSEDGTVSVISTDDSSKPILLKGHKQGVQSVTFAPDGKTLASAGDDGIVRLWDWLANKEVRSLKGHQGSIRGLAYSGDGKRLATAGWDGLVLIHNTANGEVERTLRGHTYGVTGISFSPDGMRLASSSEDRTVKLWDLSSGRELLSLSGHDAGVTGVAFSDDGAFLASSCWDQFVRVWPAPRP